MENIENKSIRDLISEIKFRKKLTQKLIASEIGVANTYLSDVINGKVPYTDSVRARLIEKYSDCFLGVNDFSKSNIQTNNTGDNINGTTVNVTKSDSDRLLELLDRSSMALSKSQEQLSKSQEQIDRLITIIEMFNNK